MLGTCSITRYRNRVCPTAIIRIPGPKTLQGVYPCLLNGSAERWRYNRHCMGNSLSGREKRLVHGTSSRRTPHVRRIKGEQPVRRFSLFSSVSVSSSREARVPLPVIIYSILFTISGRKNRKSTCTHTHTYTHTHTHAHTEHFTINNTILHKYA